MRPNETNCKCGHRETLQYDDKTGAIGDYVEFVTQVPVYFCDHCGFRILKGPDALRYAERIEEAKSLGIQEIDFEGK